MTVVLLSERASCETMRTRVRATQGYSDQSRLAGSIRQLEPPPPFPLLDASLRLAFLAWSCKTAEYGAQGDIGVVFSVSFDTSVEELRLAPTGLLAVGETRPHPLLAVMSAGILDCCNAIKQ